MNWHGSRTLVTGGASFIGSHLVDALVALDGVVFSACLAAGVDKVVYASSGCVYPTHLQDDPARVVYLAEDMVGPPTTPITCTGGES